MKMAMLLRGANVVLLTAIGAVSMLHDAQLLEDVERSIHGRRGRVRIDGATAVNQLAAGDVTVAAIQRSEHQTPLGRPAQSAPAEVVAHLCGVDAGS
jgi:hypothetical protein